MNRFGNIASRQRLRFKSRRPGLRDRLRLLSLCLLLLRLLRPSRDRDRLRRDRDGLFLPLLFDLWTTHVYVNHDCQFQRIFAEVDGKSPHKHGAVGTASHAQTRTRKWNEEGLYAIPFPSVVSRPPVSALPADRETLTCSCLGRSGCGRVRRRARALVTCRGRALRRRPRLARGRRGMSAPVPAPCCCRACERNETQAQCTADKVLPRRRTDRPASSAQPQAPAAAAAQPRPATSSRRKQAPRATRPQRGEGPQAQTI